jgi:hypothetical protein
MRPLTLELGRMRITSGFPTTKKGRERQIELNKSSSVLPS